MFMRIPQFWQEQAKEIYSQAFHADTGPPDVYQPGEKRNCHPWNTSDDLWKNRAGKAGLPNFHRCVSNRGGEAVARAQKRAAEAAP
jgi:hypothetical protein